MGFVHVKNLSTRGLAYALLAIAVLLIVFAWVKSFPISDLESPTSYLYDSIYPSLWPGISIANVGLFLIATRSASRRERLLCAFAFFILAYSIKYFFTFLEGPDIGLFLGLTEDFSANRILVPEQHMYYQWPALFVLGTITSDVLGMSSSAVAGILFFIWTFLLSAGLFLYSSGKDDARDFLSVIAYGIAAYTYLNWQFAAWTFGLTLMLVCFNLIRKDAVSYRIALMTAYAALVFTHAFLAVFVIIATCLMAVKNRGYTIVAISLGSIYALYSVMNAPWLVLQLGAVLGVEVLSEYSFGLAVTMAEPVSVLDTFTQVVSRSVTLSMWGLLSLLTLSALLAKKLRAIDISVGLGASMYALVGAMFAVLGHRTIEILILPTVQAARCFNAAGRARRMLLGYFLIAMMIAPVGWVHHYYNDTNYMTLKERHAADTIFLASARGGAATDFTLLARVVANYYMTSKSHTDTWHFIESDEPGYLVSAAWFDFVFMSPELKKGLIIKAGFSDSELSGFERTTVHFSRIYSNGQVSVLLNPNATSVPEIED
jgi:hypothetical protein